MLKSAASLGGGGGEGGLLYKYRSMHVESLLIV
jgi:hypothetical protein